MFKLVDRHILSEWLKMLGLITGAMVCLFMLQSMYDTFGDLMSYDASLLQIGFYYMVLAPSFISNVLPIAILLSLLYSLGRLHRDNEFSAFRSAGMSLFRITRWIWIFGLFFSVGLLFLNGGLVPWSIEQSKKILNNLELRHEALETGTDQVGLVKAVAFDNRKEGRVWFINRFSRYSYEAYGVTVSILNEKRQETQRIIASRGYYDDVDRVWVFHDGREMFFDPVARDIVRNIRFKEKIMPELKDDPTLMLIMEKRPKDLSFLEIKRVLNAKSTADDPKILSFKMRYHGMMAGTMSCLIMVGLAIPFAVSGVRTNPAVGVSKALALFAGYYVLLPFSLALGEQGVLAPLVAAWLPNLIALVLSFWFLRKVA